MSILEKFNIKRDQHAEKRAFRIQTLRFRKLLENANNLLDLYEDGSEKLKGEYILDNHYVISLVDSMIEKLGKVVYDVCTLAPHLAEKFYSKLDETKTIADRLISDKSIPGPVGHTDLNGNQNVIYAEPEYQLLSNVLKWFNGESDISGMNLLKQAVEDSIFEIDKKWDLKSEIASDEIWLKETNSRIFLLNLWKDTDSAGQMPVSLSEFGSVPLNLVLMDALQDRNASLDRSDLEEQEWIVAASEHEISMMRIKKDFRLRLDATVSGYEESDYIFMYLDHSLSPEALIPPGFHIEKIGSGSLCWKLDVSSEAIEDTLITIGRSIFGVTADQSLS